MSAKSVGLKYLCFSTVCSALCICLAFHAAGWVFGFLLLSAFIPFLFASSGGIFFTPSRVHTILVLFAACIIFFQAFIIRRSLNPDLGLPEDRICSVEGRVIYDSSFTQSGNHMMKISLRSCSAENGDRCTAEGVLTVLGQEEQIVSSGIAISLKGSFSEGMFVYDELQVTGRSWFNTFRERTIGFLKRRMISSGDDGPSLLSCQLLLGRTDDGSLDMVRKARSCGCAHVLALSGMHLGILVGICTAIFGKGKLGKALSVLAVAAFVMVAGPRPSLVRAALGCCLFFIDNRKRMFLVLFIQLLVFPQSFYEVGCCYGYVAVFAIVHLAPYIEAVLFQYIGQFSKLVSATVSALLFTAPVQMLSNGFWCPCAIIASPLAGLLAALSMILGLLELSFGKVTVLVRLNGLVYSLMERLFDTFSRWPKAAWPGYAMFVASIGLVFIINHLERKSKCYLTPYKIGNNNGGGKLHDSDFH